MVDRDDGDALLLDDGEHAHARSSTIAKPIPPWAQMEIRPNCTSRRRISLASVVTIRAPVAPKGCPMAIEPPRTLVMSQSTSPTGPGEPEAVGPGLGAPGLDVGQHLRRERLVDLDEPEVVPAEARALERARHRDGRAHEQLPARIDRGDGVAADGGQRPVAEGARLLVRHQHHRGGAVGERARRCRR